MIIIMIMSVYLAVSVSLPLSMSMFMLHENGNGNGHEQGPLQSKKFFLFELFIFQVIKNLFLDPGQKKRSGSASLAPTATLYKTQIPVKFDT
jgi:hypothetical protein